MGAIDWLMSRPMKFVRGRTNDGLSREAKRRRREEPYRLAKRLVGREDPVIVDGGAYVGEMTQLFLQLFRQPTVHAIEPLPNHVEEIRRNVGNRESVVVHPVAIGAADGKVEFNVNVKSNTSSVLKPSSVLVDYRSLKGHGHLYAVKDFVTVDQRRLDAIVPGPIDILKLDLQGYELEALRGATALLPECKVIITECEFVPYYEGQPLFSDLDQFLRANGFRLMDLFNLKREPDGQLAFCDAVYVNTAHWAAMGLRQLSG